MEPSAYLSGLLNLPFEGGENSGTANHPLWNKLTIASRMKCTLLFVVKLIKNPSDMREDGVAVDSSVKLSQIPIEY